MRQSKFSQTLLKYILFSLSAGFVKILTENVRLFIANYFCRLKIFNVLLMSLEMLRRVSSFFDQQCKNINLHGFINIHNSSEMSNS